MDAVEDIKSRLSIEDVVSRYVELKRAGRNFRGLSPFTSEKTPSFMVSPEKQIWHDFSSGKGGNMFSFVMEMEGVDFKAALELLARQAGVDLSQYQRGDGTRGKQKERLGEALELAAKFYQAHFKKNKTALEYIFKKRGYNKQTALDFRIGYSPASGQALTKFLLGKGFTAQELKNAGLATQLHGGLTDMFRGRVMIPLMDPFGKVIGFTARLLEDQPNAPKYINTPQTPLYDKSRHVFGLHLAKEAIRKGGYVVVVEGNLDVIASHQADVKQTVATAGTAMTAQHLKMVGRLTNDVRLAFDQDKAGLAAAERTIPLASQANVSLGIITVVGAKDPDELIQKDPKLWQQAIDSPQYAVDWLIEHYQSQLDLNSAQGKRQFTDILLKIVRGLNDSVEQDHYVVRISELIGVSADALRTKLDKGTSEARPRLLKKTDLPVQDPSQREQIKAQNHYLAIMLLQPGLRMYLKGLTEEILPEQPAQKLLTFLQEDTKFVFKNGAKTPTGTSEYCQILVLLYEELYQSLELVDLRYEAAQLQARLIAGYVKSKKIELANKMRQGGETAELLNQARELDKLLNGVKEKING
jgi:DNA primase